MNQPPIILCIGGHDPTGGAGIQADIEAVSALGGRPITLVTALTVQDSRDVRAVLPTDPGFFRAAGKTLLDDIRADAVKIGLTGSAELAAVIRQLLQNFTGPVVLDPVLAAGGGFDLADDRLARAIQELLVPIASLVTPNLAEALRLTGADDGAAAAGCLIESGAGAVLLTTADASTGDQVVNRLFCPGRAVVESAWPRLAGTYHGSGCTLASACATRLASGEPLQPAVEQAQSFTWQALNRADAVGSGQLLPWRRR